ncbi:MAG: UDP-N-acetylmuramoyl-L-alanyl-D-glutamate--2,6-diaminopimelate ligase [Gammaproteobacteria bacterium]|nr:UDP-N-acetylmuramoyl-L-alanyl-D-glutamate--2,6-diaminopimelate ligase [Gammaproteobacteria bacterium]
MSMNLRTLLDDATLPDVQIEGLTEDSRQVKAGDGFIAIRGAVVDGHDFAMDAERRGAMAVLAQRADLKVNIPVVAVAQLPARRGALAAKLYGDPSRNLRCVGVTGTNGKTSIAHFIADLAGRLGEPAGYMGTIGWGDIGSLEQTKLTTEDAVTIQKRLARFAKEGKHWVAMEASSHALHQGRVDDVAFHTAVFSNLSRDHLDYHPTFDDYAQAKSRLFECVSLQLAVVNVDDPFGRTLEQRLLQRSGRRLLQRSGRRLLQRSGRRPVKRLAVLSYGSGDADIRWRDLRFSNTGVCGKWSTPWGSAEFSLPLVGEFFVANVAAALGVLCSAGHDLTTVVSAAEKIVPVPGRMEFFQVSGGPAVVVDFAHTPDALEKVLATLRRHTEGELVCVFGCGGDRDPGKRPLMARTAERCADVLWLTSDNPRSEDPEHIISDMRKGLMDPGNTFELPDRTEAITRAVESACAEDLILVAGKGHEQYQEIQGQRIPYSDRELVARLTGGMN